MSIAGPRNVLAALAVTTDEQSELAQEKARDGVTNEFDMQAVI
jgi:hypothetical protein